MTFSGFIVVLVVLAFWFWMCRCIVAYNLRKKEKKNARTE